MNNTCAAALTAMIAFGCASNNASTDASTSRTAPPIEIHITGSDLTRDILYMGGPVAVRFEVTVTNPTGEALKLRALDLRTVGPASFALRTGSTTVNQTIAAGGKTTIRVAAWGRSAGGYIASDEPILIRGVAMFQRPNNKTFPRIFSETLTSP